MAAPPKVLVVGAIQGNIVKAFQKISKLHSKQNFSFALIAGDVFASEASEQTDTELQKLLDGTVEIPLPTYFTLGNHSLPESVTKKLESDGEVCPNLFFLGRKGTLTTTEGIRIVSLGGRLVQNEGSVTRAIGKYDPLYLESEARSLAGAHSTHILLTNQWPTGITKYSAVSVPESIDSSSSEQSAQSISNLCLALKPRYHFSSTPSASWSREPFIHPQNYESYETSDNVTRFTSLASVETSNKEWMSAFILDPNTPPSSDGAQKTCPLSHSSSPKRKRPTDSDNYSRFDTDASTSHHGRNRNKRQRQQNQGPQSSATCFMCMSNPTFNADMLVSISDDSFLTVLKGPLPQTTKTFPQLQSSGHIMIIPMYHASDSMISGSTRVEADLSAEFDSMNKYRHALNQMLASHSLGAVCWEVNRTGIRHLHWQLIGCPPKSIEEGLVEAAYKVAAEKNGYPPFHSCKPDELLPDNVRADYFRVWIWMPSLPSQTSESETQKKLTPAEQAEAIANGHDDDNDPSASSTTSPTIISGKDQSLFFPIPSSQRFNISFGREVMAGLLQLENRSDWRTAAAQGGEQEDADAFKRDFERWDFAMA